MKRIVLVMVILVSILMSSCSTYTCPTYAKYRPYKQVETAKLSQQKQGNMKFR